MNTLDYASQLSRMGCLVETLILRHGIAFTDVLIRRPTMTPRQCFQNAAKTVLKRRRLVYVEGLAKALIPAQHAWVCTPEGTVIDPTWGDSGSDYFGIPIRFDFLMAKWKEGNGVFAGILDDWRDGHALQRLPISEWIDLEFVAKIKQNTK